MGKILGVILLIAVGFGGGWFARSYTAADRCLDAGGAVDTNRGVCTGVAAATIAPQPR